MLILVVSGAKVRKKLFSVIVKEEVISKVCKVFINIKIDIWGRSLTKRYKRKEFTNTYNRNKRANRRKFGRSERIPPFPGQYKQGEFTDFREKTGKDKHKRVTPSGRDGVTLRLICHNDTEWKVLSK